MLTDILAWYLTRETAAFAHLPVFGGALPGLSLNFQVLLSLYPMWFCNLSLVSPCPDEPGKYGR